MPQGAKSNTCRSNSSTIRFDGSTSGIGLSGMPKWRRDFAPDRCGGILLEEAKADFEAGRFKPLDEVLAGVGSKRGDPSGRKTRA